MNLVPGWLLPRHLYDPLAIWIATHPFFGLTLDDASRLAARNHGIHDFSPETGRSVDPPAVIWLAEASRRGSESGIGGGNGSGSRTGTSPRQARRALAYVLNNWRKHEEDRAPFAADWKLDPYSTAVHFGGWKERAGEHTFWRWRDGYDPMLVHQPRTWLLSESWKRYGAPSCWEIPSKPI